MSRYAFYIGNDGSVWLEMSLAGLIQFNAPLSMAIEFSRNFDQDKEALQHIAKAHKLYTALREFLKTLSPTSEPLN